MIGEALNQLKKLNPTLAESVTDSWKIIGFRNQIVHGYGKLDDFQAWDTTQRSLPMLLAEVTALLAS